MTLVVPFANEAERQLLGAALWSSEAAELVATEVEPTDFHDPAHQVIARSVRTLVAGGQPVTPEVVAVDIERAGVLSTKDRPKFLYDLMDAASIIGVRRFVDEIWDCAARRRVFGLCDEVKMLAADRTCDFTEIEAKAREIAGASDAPQMAGEPDPDVSDFIDESDEYDWLVPGLLERGDRLMVTGEEGQGKSTLLRQFAVCVAAGIGPFGVGANTPRRVMILDCENGRAQIRRELRRLLIVAHQRQASPGPGMLRICARPQGIDLASRADVRWLRDRIQADEPELVVMGPLYKLVGSSPVEEEPAQAVRKVLDTFRERHNLTLIIEAHAPHAQGDKARDMRPYGASLWKRWPEFGIGLAVSAGDKTGGTADVKHWRGPREERAWPKQLRRGGSWPWTAAA